MKSEPEITLVSVPVLPALVALQKKLAKAQEQDAEALAELVEPEALARLQASLGL